jgi:hypothetical protein
MVLEFVSSLRALLFNGKAIHVINRWHLIIDTDMEAITMRQRNNNLISVSEQVISFKYIRSIQINRHLVGADVHITLSNVTLSAYGLSVDDAQAIKHVLLEYNRKAEINTLMLA